MHRTALVCPLVLVLSVAGVASQGEADAAAAVVRLRTGIADAAGRKDRAALEALLTDDFTHTHAVGLIDARAARIRSLVSGDATIETVKPAEIAIRAYGPETAVAVGRSVVGADTFRWTVVYVRQGGVWRAAASHASRVE